MADRRRCDWCGRAAEAIGDDGARELGWLVGVTAMCVDCQGPCAGCGQQECLCDCHLVALDEYVRNRSVCICGWRSNVYPTEKFAIKAGMAHIKYPDGTRPNTRRPRQKADPVTPPGVSQNLGAVPWCSALVGTMPARPVSPASTGSQPNRVASVWELLGTNRGRP